MGLSVSRLLSGLFGKKEMRTWPRSNGLVIVVLTFCIACLLPLGQLFSYFLYNAVTA